MLWTRLVAWLPVAKTVKGCPVLYEDELVVVLLETFNKLPEQLWLRLSLLLKWDLL